VYELVGTACFSPCVVRLCNLEEEICEALSGQTSLGTQLSAASHMLNSLRQHPCILIAQIKALCQSRSHPCIAGTRAAACVGQRIGRRGSRLLDLRAPGAEEEELEPPKLPPPFVYSCRELIDGNFAVCCFATPFQRSSTSSLKTGVTAFFGLATN
jgi:hypothetical protein